MKVYVMVAGRDYECDVTVGVFADPTVAEDACGAFVRGEREKLFFGYDDVDLSEWDTETQETTSLHRRRIR